jgi:hypothetical protein
MLAHRINEIMHIKAAVPIGQIRPMLISAASSVIKLRMAAVGSCNLKTASPPYGRKLAVMIITVGLTPSAVIRQRASLSFIHVQFLYISFYPMFPDPGLALIHFR